MKTLMAFLALAVVAASAYELDEAPTELESGGARFLGLNSSNTATVITLIGALILLGVIAYLIYVGGTNLGGTGYGYGGYGYGGYGGYNRNDYEQAGQFAEQGYARSADGFDFNSLNVIQWISMLQDIYEKFDYNDLECQKRLICEVMKEPTYYGSAAQKFKTGFQYAKYLEVLSLPDDMRDLLDEYLDANSAAEMNKECNEFFTCPFSIKDSFKRNLSGNSL